MLLTPSFGRSWELGCNNDIRTPNWLHVLQTDGAKQLSLEPSMPWRVKAFFKTRQQTQRHKQIHYLTAENRIWRPEPVERKGNVLHEWDITFRFPAGVENSVHQTAKTATNIHQYKLPTSFHNAESLGSTLNHKTGYRDTFEMHHTSSGDISRHSSRVTINCGNTQKWCRTHWHKPRFKTACFFHLQGREVVLIIIIIIIFNYT